MKSPSPNYKIWEFINSGIFLWLLTTIIVSGATKLYQDYQERKALAEHIERADIEIQGRLSHFISLTEPLMDKIPITSYHLTNDSALTEFNHLWMELQQPPTLNHRIFCIDTDFQQQSLPSLMTLLANDLSKLGHDVDETDMQGFKGVDKEHFSYEIDSIKRAMKTLMSTFDLKTRDEKALKERFDILYKQIIIARWKYDWNTDCTSNWPFC